MIDQLIELYSSGLTVNQIAVETGIYNQKVKKLLKEAGVYGTAPEMLSEYHDKIVKLCGDDVNYQEIAKQVGTSRWKVVEYCKKHGLYERTQVEATPELNEEILRLYEEGVSSPKIAKQVGVSKWYVLQVIPQEEKKTKAFYNTYSCNYQFFENIDNEVKAYFLGLFYADGYNNQKNKSIRIGFANKDLELLHKFVEAIESTHPLYVRKDKKYTDGTFTCVTISSTILSADLAKHGCVVAKTHVLDKMPILSDELYRHFIRGYFDGDGSVYYTQSGNTDKITLSWTGNKPFLEDVQDYLIKELEVSKTAIYISHPDRNNLIGDLRYSNGTATKIHNWMYSDCQYYSERKKMIPVLRPQVLEEKGLEYARSVMDEFYNKINKIN